MKIHDFNYKTIWQMVCILFLVGIGIYSHCHTPKKQTKQNICKTK